MKSDQVHDAIDRATRAASLFGVGNIAAGVIEVIDLGMTLADAIPRERFAELVDEAARRRAASIANAIEDARFGPEEPPTSNATPLAKAIEGALETMEGLPGEAEKDPADASDLPPVASASVDGEAPPAGGEVPVENQGGRRRGSRR